MASTFGKNLTVSIFGESHGSAIGVTISGFPSGFKINMEDLHEFLGRRAPGGNKYSTSRTEGDEPYFVSGVLDNITEGSPITALIVNQDQDSAAYEKLKEYPRPGHSDFTAHMKYDGFEDQRGGGHFSGRLTAPLAVAGGLCKQFLEEKGIFIDGYICEICGNRDNPYDEIENAMEDQDSVGGIVGCTITGSPVGIGEPIFDGVENKIAQAVFGIPAVKGIEFGRGFEATRLRGSENNDPFVNKKGEIKTARNNHGGILGGITSGMDINFRVAIKPTPSIGKRQKTVNYNTLEEEIIQVSGRHDPCIVPRAVPCVEAAAAIAMMDLYIEQFGRK